MTTFELLLPYDPTTTLTVLHDPAVGGRFGVIESVTETVIAADHRLYRDELEGFLWTQGCASARRGEPSDLLAARGWVATCRTGVPGTEHLDRSPAKATRARTTQARELERAALARLSTLAGAPGARRIAEPHPGLLTLLADLRTATGYGELFYFLDGYRTVLLMEHARSGDVCWQLDEVPVSTVLALAGLLSTQTLPRAHESLVPIG